METRTLRGEAQEIQQLATLRVGQMMKRRPIQNPQSLQMIVTVKDHLMNSEALTKVPRILSRMMLQVPSKADRQRQRGTTTY